MEKERGHSVRALFMADGDPLLVYTITHNRYPCNYLGEQRFGKHTASVP